MKNTLATTARRRAVWLGLARCYRLEATRRNPDYWLSRALKAEREADA